MKRILALLLLCFLALSGCGVPAESDSVSEKLANPYEYLLCPEEPSFGMSAVEVEDILRTTIAADEKKYDSLNGDSSYDNDYFGGFDEIPLDNYCAICGVTYTFDNPREKEFEDERTLDSISFLVRDTIPFDLRTKEKHGDIIATYETVYDFLVEHYGEPAYTSDRGFKIQIIRWNLPDQQLGIVLTLLGETDPTERGEFEVKYRSTEGLREDWYLL